MAKQNVAGDFVVVWLDSNNEKNRDDLDTKSLIRRMVRGGLLLFKNVDQCIDHIIEKLANHRVFLIVSNLLGPDTVSIVHGFPQIQSIYIYCRDRQIAEKWSKTYQKVTHIFTEKQSLLRQIGDDVGVFDSEGDIPISVFHLEEQQNTLQKLTQESARFMWYQSVLTVLPLMAKYCNSKEEMLAECRTSYPNDETERKKINEFAKTYTQTNAFWWYTYDSFVYRLLNKALRTQNIEIIFKFRFFINDLQNQIQRLYQQYLKTHKKDRLIVYRGQRMMMSEVELLKKNVNEIISMNSFVSATTIRAIAEIFADTSDQCEEESPLQSVLFIIDVLNFDRDTTPFAFIQNYSCCKDEEEVLFTIGAIFRVESVQLEKNIWHVHLQLNRQQNQQHKDLSNYMLKQIGSDPSPSTFGWFLYRMGDFNKAKRYLELLLEQLPANDIEVGNAYNLLGLIYKDLKRIPESITAYKNAVDLYARSGNYMYYCSQLIAIHCNLGLAHLALEDDRAADEQHKQAEDKLRKSSCRNIALLVAMTITLKGRIQIAREEYKQACENFQIALKKKEKKLPSDHPSIASTFNDLGTAHEKMGDMDKALKYFTQALRIREKSLPQDHLDTVECLNNIARIHDICRQPELASRNRKLAKEIEMNDIRE